MPDRLSPIARTLRNEATAAERRLWAGIRREQIEGFKFRRQVVLGDFIADFACLEARLLIEIDGATHSTHEELARDRKRSAKLTAMGFALLRFTNDEDFCNLDGVLETIRLKLVHLRPRFDAPGEGGATPLPNPPPQGGRE